MKGEKTITEQCHYTWDTPWPGHRAVLRHNRCKRKTGHESRFCFQHRPKTLCNFVLKNDTKGAVLTRKSFDRMVRESAKQFKEPPRPLFYVGSRREIKLIKGENLCG